MIERFGRYLKTLTPGLHLLVPFVDNIAYVHSLKEMTIPIPGQASKQLPFTSKDQATELVGFTCSRPSPRTTSRSALMESSISRCPAAHS